MKTSHFLASFLAAVTAGSSCLVFAETEADSPMTFRIAAEKSFVMESDLSTGDVLVPAALFIDHYSGITTVNLHLLADAPLHIENGDFTRDPSRQTYLGKDSQTGEPLYEDKQAFFEDYAEAKYTQHSDETGLENVVLWYSPGWTMNEPAEIDLPESSFLSFDIRIPKDTAPGVYACYLATGFREIEGGLKMEEFYLTTGTDVSADSVILQPCYITVEPDPLRGDVNCDGDITADDAQRTLQYYVGSLSETEWTDALRSELFGTEFIHSAVLAADADGGGEITSSDAQCILQYYIKRLADPDSDWNDVIPA